jgi:hypothetical protein
MSKQEKDISAERQDIDPVSDSPRSCLRIDIRNQAGVTVGVIVNLRIEPVGGVGGAHVCI